MPVERRTKPSNPACRACWAVSSCQESADSAARTTGEPFRHLGNCREVRAVSRYAEPMARLIEELKKLPGVGSKTAQRFAFYILRSTDEDAAALAEAVRGLKAKLRLCSICNNITDVDPCAYCASPIRNQRLVCVVEEPTSIAAVERTRGYIGVYHVLHGTLSPLHGVGPDQLRTQSLLARAGRGEI